MRGNKDDHSYVPSGKKLVVVAWVELNNTTAELHRGFRCQDADDDGLDDTVNIVPRYLSIPFGQAGAVLKRKRGIGNGCFMEGCV
jgi:hypothetical protein